MGVHEAKSHSLHTQQQAEEQLLQVVSLKQGRQKIFQLKKIVQQESKMQNSEFDEYKLIKSISLIFFLY